MTKILLAPRRLARPIVGTVLGLMAASIRFLPGSLGRRLRYGFYRRILNSLGEGVIIDEGVYIENPKSVSIGSQTWIDKNVILIAGAPSKTERIIIEKENKSYHGDIGDLKIGMGCHLAPNVLIQAHGGVHIGDYVGLASGSKVFSMSHHYRNPNERNRDSALRYKFSPQAPAKDQCLILGPVVMEDNTALGLNSVILGGVTIGKGSWVGVSSSVLEDVPPNSIAIGSPAKVVKRRTEHGSK
jgi:acetyltransferase-like isoleucine patch superfamily enzyme